MIKIIILPEADDGINCPNNEDDDPNSFEYNKLILE